MSASTEDDSNSPDDLTTDAVPSPPRDQEQVNDNGKQSEENVTRKQHQQHNNHKIPKSTGFTKIKRNTPTSAFASVINISNSQGIHIGSNYNNVTVNNKSKPEDEENKKHHVITPEINTLLTSDKAVTTEHIALISPHMRSEEWKNTARTLKYSDGQISQFVENHSRSGIKEVIYQFLLDWIQNEADGATVGKLSSALWQTSQQEVVAMWSKKFSQ